MFLLLDCELALCTPLVKLHGAGQLEARCSSHLSPEVSVSLPNTPCGLDTYLVVVCRQDLEASSPYVVSDSGGEEPKRKNKLPADVYEPNVKGKKRVSLIFSTGPAPAADFTTSL